LDQRAGQIGPDIFNINLLLIVLCSGENIKKTLTCCGDAVKTHESIETRGGTRQDSSETERGKAAHAECFPGRQKKGTQFSA